MKGRNRSVVTIAVGIFMGLAVWHFVANVIPSHRTRPKNTPSQAQNLTAAQQRLLLYKPMLSEILSPNHPALLTPSPYVHVVRDLVVEECKSVGLAKLRPKVNICIHNVSEDVWVSKAIAGGMFFEAGHVRAFQSILRSHPDLHVIDIGANIGQYSLIAAHMGRQVLAVEARKLHVHMMYRSMQLNGFLDRITLVHNAISDTHTRVELGLQANNQGATHVVESNSTKDVQPKGIKDDLSVTTILMDDLATVVNFSKAFLKMDIEGYEDRALMHSQKLFNTIFIPFIMVEWNYMKSKPADIIEPVLDWLRKEGYEPYRLRQSELVLKAFSEWRDFGYDVVFKHRTVTL